MSTPSTTSALVPDGVADSVAAVTTNFDALFRPFEALAFWSAVALPFVYIPLLLSGIETSAELLAVATLIGAHVVALVLGHHHRLDD